MPVSNTTTPYVPPAKAQVASASVQDLESTLPPVQPLEQASHASSSGTTPVLVYNHFAQLSQSTPDGRGVSAGQNTDSGEQPQTSGESGDIGADSTGAAVNVVSGVADQSGENADNAGASQPETDVNVGGGGGNAQSAGGLSDEDLAIVSELSSRDREVRSHEQAHLSVGGVYATAPQFSYERGPDGRNYAVGGEVSIDAGTVPGNPEATIRKLEQVRRAALAPAEPSPQDRRVAAQASQGILQAQADLAKQRQTGTEEPQRDEPEQSSSAAERRNSQSRAIQTYQELIGLGNQLAGADAIAAQLDEVI
ncbi:hypothetical protein BTA51_19665 [Hahella sp. CCB-MM4]|nr:hypothetical protein BTA51_19665 [Hahella sp. CCB-MM4]